MDPLRDFDDARTLGEPELRARLRDGAPAERVWCAWQLGLRHRGSHDFAEQVQREPHPGVRRHLAVAVAGAHDVDVLVAMARLDPDSGVRATAMLLATRFAAAGVIPWTIIEGGLADEAPGVREATLSALPDDARGHALARRVLADPAPEVRRAAFEVVAGDLGEDATIRGVCALLERADPDERAAVLSRWHRFAGIAGLSTGVAATSLAVRLAALDVLPREVAWVEVGPIAERAEPALLDALRWQIRDLEDVPLAVLLTWLIDGADDRVLDAAAARLATAASIDADRVARAVAIAAAIRADVIREAMHLDPDDTNPDRRPLDEQTAPHDRFLAAAALWNIVAGPAPD